MDIETLLKNYRINKAKIRCGELEIEGLEEYIKKGPQYDSTKDEEIEGMSLAVNASDMPRSVTNKFHSIVEDVAMSYCREWAKRPPTPLEVRERIAEIKSRIEPLRQEVKIVDEVILPCLNAKELFVIKKLYIEGYSWKEITEIYADEFDIKEERTLKDIRKFAFQKIKEVIKTVA